VLGNDPEALHIAQQDPEHIASRAAGGFRPTDRVAVYDALRGGYLIGTERTTTGATQRTAKLIAESLDELDASIRASGGADLTDLGPIRLLVNETKSTGNAAVLPRAIHDASLPHVAVGPVIGDPLADDYLGWASRQSPTTRALALMRTHESRSVIAHELAHLEQAARLPHGEAILSKSTGSPRAVGLRHLEVAGAHEALADIYASARTQSWDIKTGSGYSLRTLDDPHRNLLQHVRFARENGRSVVSALRRAVPWSHPAIRTLVSNTESNVMNLDPHVVGTRLSSAATKMQPTLGWEKLAHLVHATTREIAATDGAVGTVDETASAMQRAAQTMWGASSSESRAVSESLRAVRLLR
jgi:hypothetical protein